MTKEFAGNGKKKLVSDIFFYGFLLVYATSMIYLCGELNIWVDEAYTLNTTSNNLSGVIRQSYHFEGQPPVYFLLLSIWRYIDQSIFFARSFSLIFITFATIVFSKLIRLLLGSGTASRWMIVLFLLNPFTVWAGLEIRLYAFLLFLSISAVYFFFKFYTGDKKKYLYYLIVACIFGVYTQYFFLFLMGGLAISLLIFRGWSLFFKFCLYMIPVAVLFLPSLLFAPALTKYVQTQASYSSTPQVLYLFQSTQNLLLAFQMAPFESLIKWSIRIIFGLAITHAYYKLYTQNKQLGNMLFQRINIIVINMVFFVFFLAIFFAVTKVDYQYRYLTILMPMAVLLLLLFNIYAVFVKQLIYGLIAVYYILLLVINYREPVKQYDYKQIADHVTKTAKNGEPVLFYHGAVSLSFMYYYKGSNPVMPLPGKIRFDSTTYISDIKDTVELKQVIEGIPTPSRSYLLVSDLTEERYINEPNKKMVDSFLSSHYNITMDTLYFGRSKEYALRIRRLEKE
jgi:hypothetical protein